MAEMNQDNGGGIDLRRLLRAIGRRRIWIIAPVLAALALTFAAVSLIKPRYTAEVKVLLESQESYFTQPEKVTRDTAAVIDPEAVASQVQLVTSRDVARQAIRRLDLLSSPEFDPLIEGMSPVTRVLVLLGLQRDPAQMSPEDRVMEVYFDKLTVFSVARTRVLTIEFTSRSPELAAKAANTIADIYLAAQGEAKKSNVKSAAGWLSRAIDDLRIKVAQAEAKVDDFRSNSGLFTGANNINIPSQQLADLNAQLATARAAQAEAQAKGRRLAELIRQGRLLEVSDIVKDDLVRRIGEQRVTVKAQLALESRTLLPGHPRIKELQAQLADIENEMRAAAEKSARGLENDGRVAASRVESIQAAFDTQRKAVTSSNSEDVTLRAYEREAKAAREQLESFLQKYREASARDTDNAAPADGRIISRAIAPQLPSFPKKVPMLAIAGLGALFLSFGLVSARALLSGEASPEGGARPRPVSPSVEPDENEGARPPAVMSPVAAAAARPLAGRSPASLLDSLRAARLRGGGGLCVLFTSAARGAGASANATAIARLLAHEARVILVDADAAEPALDTLVQADASAGVLPGLSDVLTGAAAFADAIHPDLGSRVHVMPAGSDAGAPALEFSGVIAALTETYDYVLIDGAPFSEGGLAIDHAGQVAVMVVVAPAGGASDDEIVAMIARSEHADLPETLVLRAARARRESAAQAA